MMGGKKVINPLFKLDMDEMMEDSKKEMPKMKSIKSIYEERYNNNKFSSLSRKHKGLLLATSVAATVATTGGSIAVWSARASGGAAGGGAKIATIAGSAVLLGLIVAAISRRAARDRNRHVVELCKKAEDETNPEIKLKLLTSIIADYGQDPAFALAVEEGMSDAEKTDSGGEALAAAAALGAQVERGVVGTEPIAAAANITKSRWHRRKRRLSSNSSDEDNGGD